MKKERSRKKDSVSVPFFFQLSPYTFQEGSNFPY